MTWQPIKTCPRDERFIWVVGGMYEKPALTYSGNKYWLGEKPTHWHPVVPPAWPSQNEERDEEPTRD